jgi:hypothetical protein
MPHDRTHISASARPNTPGLWTSLAKLTLLRHPPSRLLNAAQTLLLVKPPTRSRNLPLLRKVAMPNRAIRRGSAAPTNGHPSVGFGDVVLVELTAELGCVV